MHVFLCANNFSEEDQIYGSTGPPKALTSALLDDHEGVSRAAAHGLVASGPEAAQYVLKLLTLGFSWRFLGRPQELPQFMEG